MKAVFTSITTKVRVSIWHNAHVMFITFEGDSLCYSHMHKKSSIAKDLNNMNLTPFDEWFWKFSSAQKCSSKGSFWCSN